MKKGLSVLLIIACICGLNGCIINRENPYPYRGRHKELYTAAIYSIPNAIGYMHHGEGAYNSDIHIWEQDAYGRTLFSYCEDYGNSLFALVLAQPCDEANVYFYPDVNYILTFIESEYCYEGADDDHLKNKTEAIYLENRDLLKKTNDWDKPLDMTKCVSYPITDHRIPDLKKSPLSEQQYNEILTSYTETCNIINPDPTPYDSSKILQVDAEGRILHEITGSHAYFDRIDRNWRDPYTFYDIILWVITDAQGNYDADTGIFVMYSKANQVNKDRSYAAEDIGKFKALNGWKYSFCDN